MANTIRSMKDRNFTNLSDGLIAGRKELENDHDPTTYRALVFFTDGRPTALRGVFTVERYFARRRHHGTAGSEPHRATSTRRSTCTTG